MFDRLGSIELRDAIGFILNFSPPLTAEEYEDKSVFDSVRFYLFWKRALPARLSRLRAEFIDLEEWLSLKWRYAFS